MTDRQAFMGQVVAEIENLYTTHAVLTVFFNCACGWGSSSPDTAWRHRTCAQGFSIRVGWLTLPLSVCKDTSGSRRAPHVDEMLARLSA